MLPHSGTPLLYLGLWTAIAVLVIVVIVVAAVFVSFLMATLAPRPYVRRNRDGNLRPADVLYAGAVSALRYLGPVLVLLLIVEAALGGWTNVSGPPTFTPSTSTRRPADEGVGYLLGLLGLVALVSALMVRKVPNIIHSVLILVGVGVAGVAGRGFIDNSSNPPVFSADDRNVRPGAPRSPRHDDRRVEGVCAPHRARPPLPRPARLARRGAKAGRRPRRPVRAAGGADGPGPASAGRTARG